MPTETEIKLPIADIAAIRKQLRDLGFRSHVRRLFESNTIFDTPRKRLRRRGELVRIRQAGSQALLTFKGPQKKGRHKVREEIESKLDHPDAMQQVLERLGFEPVFRYEKYREEFSRKGAAGIITVDETPIGNYLELEGAPKWIDATARELGYSRSDYITMSYGSLYLEYCRKHGVRVSNMTFDAPSRRTPDR